MSNPGVRPLLRFLAYLAPLSILGFAWWVRHTFGDVTVDQALWHLQYADGAAVQMSEVFFAEFAMEVLIFPAALAALAAVLHGAAARRCSGRLRVGLRTIAPASFVIALTVMALQFGVTSFALAYATEDPFAASFVEPRRVQLVPQQRRNLVVIYAESMESSYSDREVFGRDLLGDMRQLPGHSFARYRQVPGANWTIAAIVATQCGVPLKVYWQVDVRAKEDGKSFLAGATCLGDLLQAHGYRNVFLGGAPLSFAGKGRFLADHGYDERWGRDEWDREGVQPGELNAWGMHDAPLFRRARAALDRLHAAGQPFNLTVLTLDTHQPFGFLSNDCRARGGAGFQDIVSCTSHDIAQFIRHAQRSGYLENTTIAVIGDHLAYPNPVYDKLEQVSDRGMFNLFVGKLPQPNREALLPYDMFPTLMEIAGFRVRGDRLALGYSAVGPVDAIRPERPESWSAAALRPSASYDALWRGESALPLAGD